MITCSMYLHFKFSSIHILAMTGVQQKFVGRSHILGSYALSQHNAVTEYSYMHSDIDAIQFGNALTTCSYRSIIYSN